ncbi:hypothetical protein ACFXG4_17060 [Nocardia sp. NPDC059246]|uniref:hypothetical protein n=1 Tax=unclassified Nocardia TaxID=2637762 RepID=UPI0036C20B16
MSVPPIFMPVLPEPWTVDLRSRSRTTVVLDVRRPVDGGVTVELERCASGRLRHTYPVNSHDVEARVTGTLPGPLLADLLGALLAAVEAADPNSRRLVFAASADDHSAIAAAESVGFRYVVDVDLPDDELSLLVAEPNWVTAVDMDLDHVPGT